MGRKETRKRSRKKRLWPKILIGLIAVLCIAFASGYFIVHSKVNKMDKVEVNKTDLGISTDLDDKYHKPEKIKNIALFGVDAPDGENGRSDSIMIATIDPINNKMKLTSIMRDSYVNIPGYGLDKINHAYAYGGPQLAMKTINENFGLNISDFATVNFSSLPIIIDSLGGVDIDITDEEVSHIPGIGYAGTHTLTGDQALAYSRIRYAEGGDYKRTERQRTVLEGLFNKALSMPVSSYMSTLDTILPYVQTNMSTTNILSIGTKALSSFNGELQQQRFPLDGYCQGEMINGVYYLTFDAETTKQQFMDYIFEDTLN